MDWIRRTFRSKSSSVRTHRNFRILSPQDLKDLQSPLCPPIQLGDDGNGNAAALSDEEHIGDEAVASLSDLPNSSKVQFVSDLHLEKNGYDALVIPRAAPYLLLLGDTGLFRQETQFLSFLRRQCENFDLVMLVLGNHEFYGVSRKEGLEMAQRLEDELEGRLAILKRRRVDMPDGQTVVLGCTLHSHIPADYTALTNDFANIHDWRVADHNAEHERDRQWLKQSLQDLSTQSNSQSRAKRVIIATHYAPSYTQTCHPEQEGNALRHCFCSDTLDEMAASRKRADIIAAWVFGHTHYNVRLKKHGVWCTSNHLEGRNPQQPFNVRAMV